MSSGMLVWRNGGHASMGKLQRSWKLIMSSAFLSHLSFQTPSWDSNSKLSWKFALCFDSWVPSSLTVSTPSTTSPLGPYKNACCVLSSLSHTCSEILTVKQKITCHTEQGNIYSGLGIPVVFPKGYLIFLGKSFVTTTVFYLCIYKESIKLANNLDNFKSWLVRTCPIVAMLVGVVKVLFIPFIRTTAIKWQFILHQFSN